VSKLRNARSRKVLPVAAAVCAVSILAAACSSSGSVSNASGTSIGTSGNTVDIGVILPLSGEFAAAGIPVEQGAEAAVKYLNAGHSKAKGVKYKLVVRDGQGNATQDEALARQLTQAGVRYFLGDIESTAGYEAEQTAFNQDSAISFASEPIFDEAGIGKPYPWAFGVGSANSSYEVPYVDYVKSHSKNGKVGIIYMDYQVIAEWGQDTTELAKKAGLQVQTESVSATATDVTAQLRSLRSSGADSLIVDAVDPIASTVLQGLSEIGWTPSVVAVTSIPSSADLNGLSPALVKNVVGGPIPDTFLGSSVNASPQGLALSYVNEYAPLLGEKPGSFDATQIFHGSYLFDAVLILDQAIAKAGTTDTTAVQKVLDSGVPFNGSRGTYVYGPTNRTGPVTTNWGLYYAGSGCPNGICERAS
jgi:branched-chain amino acid transport system substrate-binding protein